MNKILLTTFVVASMLISLGFASAATLVDGKIYNADFTSTIPGAIVDVTCVNLANETTTLGTTSIADGSYFVTFANEQCTLGDQLSVHAWKDGVGENTVNGTVSLDLSQFDLSIGVVNVPLIPEFGMLIGTLTLVSAVGMFFFIRKN